MHYLYKITNLVNNKLYIGQTRQPHKRWWQHRWSAAKPTNLLHKAINKYGAHNFTFEIIATAKTKEDANVIEIELIAQYKSHASLNNGYNAAKGGSSNSGYTHSEATKRKISGSNKGQKRSEEIKQMISENTKKQFATKGHPRQGTTHTEASKQKMRESSMGQVAWNKGLEGCYSDETRQKMSDAKVGRTLSDETKAKMSASRTKNRTCGIEGCDRPHDAKGYCSRHYYHLIDKTNRPWAERKLSRKRRISDNSK